MGLSDAERNLLSPLHLILLAEDSSPRPRQFAAMPGLMSGICYDKCTVGQFYHVEHSRTHQTRPRWSSSVAPHGLNAIKTLDFQSGIVDATHL
jgi:hypothetical protein